jgi:hypothetical protein
MNLLFCVWQCYSWENITVLDMMILLWHLILNMLIPIWNFKSIMWIGSFIQSLKYVIIIVVYSITRYIVSLWFIISNANKYGIIRIDVVWFNMKRDISAVAFSSIHVNMWSLANHISSLQSCNRNVLEWNPIIWLGFFHIWDINYSCRVLLTCR